MKNYSQIFKSWVTPHNMHTFFLSNHEFESLTGSDTILRPSAYRDECLHPLSNIEKVPSGIQGEKSRKDTASSGKLVSTIRRQVSPHRGQNQV